MSRDDNDAGVHLVDASGGGQLVCVRADDLLSPQEALDFASRIKQAAKRARASKKRFDLGMAECARVQTEMMALEAEEIGE